MWCSYVYLDPKVVLWQRTFGPLYYIYIHVSIYGLFSKSWAPFGCRLYYGTSRSTKLGPYFWELPIYINKYVYMYIYITYLHGPFVGRVSDLPRERKSRCSAKGGGTRAGFRIQSWGSLHPKPKNP